MASNEAAGIKDIVTCTICLSYYKDPRLLACSHTYCYDCIKQLIQGDQFVCPLRDGTSIKAKDVKKLPVNRTAKDVVEFLSNTFQNTANLKCENCTINQSVYWCEKCECYLCQTCSQTIHSHKIHQNHVIVAASQKSLPNLCSDHPDEKLKYWCITCEDVVCRDGLLLKHKDHNYTNLQDIVNETKLKIQSSLQPIRQNLEKAAEKTRSIIEEQRLRHEATKIDIDETFTKLQTLLKQRKKELMNQFDKCQQNEIAILESYQRDISEQMSIIRARETLIQQISDHNSNIQFMKMRNTLLDDDQQINQLARRFDQESTFPKVSFNKNTEIEQKIAEYGTVEIDNIAISLSDTQVKNNFTTLNLSLSSGMSLYSRYEADRGRGYLFQLNNPLMIQSVQLEASIYRQSICLHMQ